MRNILYVVIIGCVVYLTYYVSIKPELEQEKATREALIPPPKGIKKSIKGYDFRSGHYIRYTDDEIRALRDENPDYIIKVPGRIIESKEEEFERAIEEYLEDHDIEH